MRIVKSFSFSSITFSVLFALSISKFNFCLLILSLTHLCSCVCLWRYLCECASVLQLYQSNKFMVECEGQCDLTTRLLTEAEVEQVLSLHRWSSVVFVSRKPTLHSTDTNADKHTNTQTDNCWLSNIRFCITYSTPFHKHAMLPRWICSSKTFACMYTCLCICQLVHSWLKCNKRNVENNNIMRFSYMVIHPMIFGIWMWDWW